MSLFADDSIADAFYLQLPTGRVSQADIWCNLPHGDVVCTGIIITPRCDFAHAKARVFNYLPIVPVKEYLEQVTFFSYLKAAANDLRDSLQAKSCVFSLDCLFELGLPLDPLEQAIRAQESALEGKQLKAYKEVIEGLAKLRGLYQLLEKPFVSKERASVFISQKKILSIQRELIRNNNADTYFLPPCEGLIICPSVVLLRHIYTCPIELLEKRQQSYEVASHFATPERVLRLKSPYIESLMSRFSTLFTRVGTRDIPEAVVSSLIVDI